MAVSSALRRLLQVRDLEEEQCRLALESALGELHRLQNLLAAIQTRERLGRAMAEGRKQGGSSDRQAGRVEAETARSTAKGLQSRMIAAGNEVSQLRRAYLEKRVERQQAGTLIEETEAAEAIEQGRRSQQSLDDAHRARLYSVARSSAAVRRGVESSSSDTSRRDMSELEAKMLRPPAENSK